MTEASVFLRPRVVLSKCLEVEACRYNSRMIRSPVVRRLQPLLDFVPVCPEVEVGLGTPRDPIHLVRIRERTHLMQPSTGRDVTGDMEDFTRRWLDDLGEVDGFILKSRSPSCGIDDIPIHPPPGDTSDDAPPIDSGKGMFARNVPERFPDLPVEHEARLAERRILDRFLTRIFALAELRGVKATGSMAELVRFQARQKLTLMAHSPDGQKELGRMVANPDGDPFVDVFARYRERFSAVLTREPGPGAHQNVLQHAMGYVSEELAPAERQTFLRLLGEYRAGAVERGALLELVRGWVDRSGEPYLSRQAYLRPYPPGLLEVSTEG